jgi:pimeloyl-ACP methyl ester carboxylesterase
MSLLQPAGDDISTILWNVWIPPMFSLMTSHTLIVPNGILYYELRGTGPLLVLIPGGNGEASIYKSVALELSRRFRVVTYDRRGYSRSTSTSTSTPTCVPDYSERRVLTDADDVARLIRHLSPDTPATVFGSGSGAIVALTLVAQHSELVRTLVAHEPPAFTLLPDGEQILEAIEEFRSAGVQAVMRMLLEVMGVTGGIGSEHTNPYAPANLNFWMENEMRQYPRANIDVESLKENMDHLLLVGGRDGKDLMPYQPNLVLAKKTGSEVIDLPGGHLGYKTHPKEFAAELLVALEMRYTSREARTAREL